MFIKITGINNKSYSALNYVQLLLGRIDAWHRCDLATDVLSVFV